MVTMTFAPVMDVTHDCVRHRFRSASCHACADVCPAQVFSLVEGTISVDGSRCIECGDCLFVCPAEAISGVTPQKRFLCGDTLVGPFTGPAPTVNELLLWHAQHRVRFISIDVEHSTAWMMALAGLNLALRRLGEPGWSFRLLPKKEINVTRRTLIHVPRDDVKPCTVLPGKRQLRKAFSCESESDIVVDPGKCVLCGACWRSCQENAIRFEAAALVVETARCTGCGGCEAVCQHKALNIIEKEEPAKTVIRQAFSATCLACHRQFWTFHPEEKQCPLCRHHHHGMRNLACC